MELLRTLVISLLSLLVVAPLLFLYRSKSPGSHRFMWQSCLFFIAYNLLLRLGASFNKFISLNLHWNWGGKLLALTGTMVFLWVYRQECSAFRSARMPKMLLLFYLLSVGLLVALGIFVFFKKTAMPIETFLFQATLPGIDEELAFRGVLLALFFKALTNKESIEKKHILTFPSVWIVTILFGLGHGIILDKCWALSINWSAVLQSSMLGIAFAWLSIRTHNIATPMIVHNLINVFISIFS